MTRLMKLVCILGFLLACGLAHADPNYGKVLFSTAARTATSLNSADQVNVAGKGVVVIIDVTTATAGSYTFTIQGKDPASGKYYTILASTAISTISTTVLRVYPGLTASPNAVASDVLPQNWRVSVSGSTPNLTFSVGAQVIE